MTQNHFNTLTEIRKNEGVPGFKSAFHKLALSQPEHAITFINHPDLSFADLYVLIPKLDELNLYKEANARDITALKLCARILKNKLLSAKIYFLSGENDETNYPVLMWMMHSGTEYDGLDDDFDQIIDSVVALLLSSYQETTILPAITDLIFKRNEQDHFTHDLIWALFQSHNPEVITLISNHLHSSNPKEVALCKSLLHYNVPKKVDAKQEEQYVSWLQDNSPYFSFTGQSFQYASNPQYFQVDLEAKYLCRPDYKDKTATAALSENNHNHLMNFRKISEDDQYFLSEYASQLYHANRQAWQKWMRYPVHEQLSIAKKALEVQHDTDSE